MTYRDNVDSAAVALQRGEDANWELARLTFESTRERGSDEQPGRVAMEEWCADVREASGRRFAASTGSQYKAVWRRFGPVEIPDRPSWTDAMLAIHNAPSSDRPERESAPTPAPPTYDELATQVYEAPPEHREYLFRRLAGDPEIVEKAAEIGSPVSRAVSGLEQKADVLRERQREQIVQSDPVATRIEQQTAAVDIAGECNRFRIECRRFAASIEALLTKVGEVQEGDLFWIREAVSDAHAALDRVERLVDSGQTDLNTFLDGVLTGERDAQH